MFIEVNGRYIRKSAIDCYGLVEDRYTGTKRHKLYIYTRGREYSFEEPVTYREWEIFANEMADYANSNKIED